MRTLFLRIFISFWIAMGLILAGGILVTATLLWRNLEALESIDSGQLAAAASDVLRSGGPAKLQQWIVDTEAENTGLNVYVLDQRGRDILARPLPGWLHERVEKSLAASGRYGAMRGLRGEAAEDAMERGRPLAREHDMHFAPEIVTAQGSGYTMVFATSGPSPLALFGRFEASFALLALALLVSGLVSWWLARFFSAPIAKLQTTARALAAGRLEARVGEKMARRRDELGVLARDFDSMAERLRTLLESRERLLRDLSHELRSPLARLRVATELARSGADLPHQLDRIERDTERLDDLIGQMLQLSRLQGAEPTRAREMLDLAQLVSEIVEDARLEAGAAGKSVRWSEGPRVRVEGDPELLRRGIENIIRNAVRFTPAGSAVEIGVETSGGSAILRVRDHGSGVPDADLARIFEPFYRVSTARERDSGGTGLGLAITARVAALHGGTVRATNCADGGLLVEFTIPLAGATS